jgi:ParB family chromosome partitioning protein
MELRRVKIDELIPADYNPRIEVKKGTKLYEQIKDSLDTFGYAEPVVANKDMTIISGHQRWSVLKQEGCEDLEVIVIDIDKTKEKALNIALNKITGSWDEDKLKGLFLDLKELEFDLKLTGFRDSELKKYFDIKLEENPGVAKEKNNKIESGQLYIINGRHKLLCGDCTNKEHTTFLFGDKKVDALITDPPYGVDYGGKVKHQKQMNKASRDDGEITGDDQKDYTKFFIDFLNKIPFNDYNVSYIFMLGPHLFDLDKAFRASGGSWGDYLLWLKNGSILGYKDYNPKHEFIYYGWRGKHKFYGPSNACSVLEFANNGNNKNHSHQKPLDLIGRLVSDATALGGLVYDPFGGSGTTLIASEKSGRICYMMEIDPNRVNDILNRIITEGLSYELC